jgi:hypothetical protein
MRLLHSARWLLLALLFSLIPASSYAGVFISVGFAPPVLPVYEQPPCPDPGLIWTPGYWAYGPDGYYWVPGAWVPPPYEGAYWTPGYWGWSEGLYMWHPGYWGPQVGYYGGVNYGFGYFGIGFVGGMWRGHDFYYNRAVWRVDDRRIHDVYEDRRDWDRHFVDRNSRVAYSGGPGGIRHDPDSQERMAMREQHLERTSFQEQHARQAMDNRNAYYRYNHGRPAEVASARPLGREMHQPPANMNRGNQGNFNNRQAQQNQQRNQYQRQENSYQQHQQPRNNQYQQQQERNNQFQQQQRQQRQYQQQQQRQFQQEQRQQQQQQRQFQQEQRQYQQQQRNNVQRETRPAPQPRDQHQTRPEANRGGDNGRKNR